ncbi:MAG: DUF5678 domain-containing protein [Candidatus Bathyarchaeia archaeon]
MSIVELISRAEEDSKWLSVNYRRLVEKYNDKWVAVLDKHVIDHDKNLKTLTTRLRRKLNKRYSEVVFEYVTKKPVNMVLVV